jgi:hypothetical protein
VPVPPAGLPVFLSPLEDALALGASLVDWAGHRVGKALVTDPLAGLAWYASHFIRIARAPKRMPR